MAISQLSSFLRHLQTATLSRAAESWTDAQLLQQFLERRDETAFGALVGRHGPMVLGVCRRILGHEADAEDAFQAVFLVLARKAASIIPQRLLANWLHGVACRTAWKARTVCQRRRAKEQQVPAMPEPVVTPINLWDDLQPLLDRELDRLPDSYRVAVILCELEGKTHREAARQLGWPVGTLSTRLARARKLLAQRLARAGVAPAIVFARAHCPPVLSVALASSTTRAATLLAAGRTAAGLVPTRVAALTEGVLKAMLLRKLKLMTVVLLTLVMLGLATGGALYSTRAAEPTSPQDQKQTALPSENVARARETPSDAPAARPARLLRWRISFDTRDGNEYAKQLEALGAILAFPTEEPAKFRVIRDLSRRPVEPALEDISKLRHIFLVDSDDRSVRSLAEALGLKPVPPQVVVYLPAYVEDELLRKELAFARDLHEAAREEAIEETAFRFFRSKVGFQVKVVSQTLKR